MLFKLFATFFKIGLFVFGGGYGMLPFLQKEIVEKGWISEDELLDYYAIGQVTPGIIAVNISTFVGYKLAGMKGALCTLLGILLPSVIVISTLFYSFSLVQEEQLFKSVLRGIQLVIPALIFPTLLRMMRHSLKDLIGASLFTAGLLASFFLPPLWLILTVACAGALVAQMEKGKHHKRKKA